MTESVYIALAGAGLIGRQHAEVIRSMSPEVELHAIVDPSLDGKSFALNLGLDWFPTLEDLFAADRPDGIVVATPNQVHVDNALTCIEQSIPVLVEKPIATTVAESVKIVDASNKSKVPVLVGHHRRHNPIIQRAKKIIEAGLLGKITSAHSQCWLLKPEDYFSQDWRRRDGAGPVMVNAIHDLDLLRFLCGDVATVHAISSNSARGFETEDTAVVLLRFASGALATLNISDAVAAPWSWELTSRENPIYDVTAESCYLIGGNLASLSLPDLRIWRHPNSGSWKDPIEFELESVSYGDPLVAQIKHFAAVIRGEMAPEVSASEGMKSLALAEAILMSAERGEIISMERDLGLELD